MFDIYSKTQDKWTQMNHNVGVFQYEAPKAGTVISNSKVNKAEADEVLYLVAMFVMSGIPAGMILILTPHQAQYDYFKSIVSKNKFLKKLLSRRLTRPKGLGEFSCSSLPFFGMRQTRLLFWKRHVTVTMWAPVVRRRRCLSLVV